MINLAKLIGYGTKPEVPVFRDKFEYTPMNFAKVMEEHNKTLAKGK